MKPRIELYVVPGCPYCETAREELDWRGEDYVEYDVRSDPAARARLLELTRGTAVVPVIAEPGAPVQVGWQGRGCPV